MANKINTVHLNNSDDYFSISLQESIKNITNQEGYVRYKVEKKIVPQAGNFLSLLYEVDITGDTADGEKKTSLFIKRSITLEKITLTNVANAYSRELLVYNELSKTFLRLQDAANVPDKEKFRFIKSYVSDNETIIMENLSKNGFKTYNGTQVVTIKFAKLSIIELAKFHAFSYIIKEKNPRYFDNKIRAIKHSFDFNRDWEGFMNNVCTVTAQVVDSEARAKVKNNVQRIIQISQKYTKDMVPSNGCLCHGDYKLLNILVKEADGEASEVQPIDYQLVYYGTPVDDFLFFIFTGTDREFRRKHLSYLKDVYFESFTKFLSYFNVDVNAAYCRREFENDYEQRLELGLVFGLYMAVFTFAHGEEGFDVSKFSLTELPIIPNKLFVDRVKGVVEDYIEWGYL